MQRIPRLAAEAAFDFVLKNSRRYGAPAEIVWRDRTIAIGDEIMATTTEKKFDDTNHGALFKNTEKQEPWHADYRGEINVNGEQFRLNAWLKTSKKGTKFLSLSVKPKDAVTQPTSTSDDPNDNIVLERGRDVQLGN
jgi:hypothetical protein